MDKAELPKESNFQISSTVILYIEMGKKKKKKSLQIPDKANCIALLFISPHGPNSALFNSERFVMIQFDLPTNFMEQWPLQWERFSLLISIFKWVTNYKASEYITTQPQVQKQLHLDQHVESKEGSAIMQARITFLLGPRISCMSSQVFSLLHLATLVLSPKCLEITNFNHHQHLFFKLNSRHLHQPFLNIHSSDGLIPCAKRNE